MVTEPARRDLARHLAGQDLSERRSLAVVRMSAGACAAEEGTRRADTIRLRAATGIHYHYPGIQIVLLLKAGDVETSGFMRDMDGRMVLVHDDRYKRRRGRVIKDEKLRIACMRRIHDRLLPEIEKGI